MSIRLVSRRGAIGKSWHAAALRDAAESILGVGRAGGGKADARAGRVQWLDVEAGIARGAVLDADGELYQARVDLPVLSPSDREIFLQIARARPELPARMAGGDYPQEIEGQLAPHEVSLLPRGPSELTHDCSCLDWPGPCRHVAALVYVLVEAVDEHPVQLLTLRGLSLEDLVAPLEAPYRAAAGDGDPAQDPDEQEDGTGEERGTEDWADAPAPPAAEYDPARTDPGLLAEVIGAGPAAIIGAFYGSQGPQGPHDPLTPSDGPTPPVGPSASHPATAPDEPTSPS